jgi:hypothetical protein
MPPMTGRVIAGRYNLQSPIGRGAMGVVWRARDQLLDREVAVKEVIISALIGADERRNAYQRTLREARTAARLSHRGVVAVYDVAEEDGRPWIIMELVPSQALDQLLTVERRLSPPRAGRIGQQLLSALAHAHSAGVLHRDVKPSNVLIANDRTGGASEERAVLTDFGIAQFEGDPRLTQTGMVMGSPGFTAPERIRGGDATPASDLWSLGATLYAAVEGRGPYEQRGGAITTMSAIINEDAPAAPHAGRLAPLIAALLRREPRERPSAMAAAVMFSQILPQLADGGDAPRAASHPPTMQSSQVPPSARPLASGPAGPAAPAASVAPAARDMAVDVPRPAPSPAAAAKQTPPVLTTPDNPEPALARAAAAAASRAADAASDNAADDPVDMEAADAGLDHAGVGDESAVDASGADAAHGDAGADEADADDVADLVTGAELGEETRDDGREDDSAATRARRLDEADDIAAAEPDKDEKRDLEVAAAGAGVVAAAAAGLGVAEVLDGAEGGAVPATSVSPVNSVATPEAALDTVIPGSGQVELPPPPVPKPAPTFTAAKPGERSGPTFSAARPATPAAPPSSGSRPPQSGWSQSGSSQSGLSQSGLSQSGSSQSSSSQSGQPQPQAGWSQSGQPQSEWSQSGPPQSGWSQSGQPQSSQPQSSQPQSGWSQSGQPQSGWAPPGGNASGWAGQGRPAGTTPLPDGGAAYAGPSQAYPDLAAQYAPGSGGGRAARSGKRGRGRLVALIVGAIVVAAAIGAGTAYALGHHSNTNLSNASNASVTYPAGFTPAPTVAALDDPSTVLPAGWTSHAVTAAQLGTKAGFSIDLPPGWKEQPDGYATDFTGPGQKFIDIDLTTHHYSDMLAEARYIEQGSMPNHPGYQRIRLDREPVRGTNGAFWKFTYYSAAGIKLQVNDILFIKPTSAGAQSYAIEFRTRDATWNDTVPLWKEIMRTFQVVPAASS